MDSVMMIGRMLVSLAAVLGVIWVIARRARKGPRAANGRTLEVLERAALSKGSSVAVVRVGDQALVLGVADSGVSVLGETDLDAALANKTAPKGRLAARAAHAAPAGFGRTAPVAAPVAAAVVTPEVAAAVQAAPRPAAGPLAGSVVSPQTWRQTLESLRDLTARV
jgi:flagellar protein FliO/FliZ